MISSTLGRVLALSILSTTSICHAAPAETLGLPLYQNKDAQPAAPAAAPDVQPTPESYWVGTGFDFTVYRRLQSNAICNRDARFFYACILGVNAILSAATQPALLSLAPMVQIASVRGEALANLGDGLLVNRRVPLPESIQDILAWSRAQRSEAVTAWEAYQVAHPNGVNFDLIYDWLESHILNDLSVPVEMAAGLAFNQVLSVVIDPHTRIEPAAQARASMQQSSQSIAGIGAILQRTQSGEVLVVETIPGSPASQHLRTLDRITAVAGQEIEGESIQDMVGRILGTPGTPVRIRVRRADETLEFKIVRARVEIQNVEEARVGGSENNLGYIRVRSFMSRSTCGQVQQALVAQNDTNGTIVDLRGNPGGLVDQVACMAGLFIGENRLVITMRNPRTNQIFQSQPSTAAQVSDKPLVVLVDARSASASEIFSGVIQDYARGWVVGQTTFGKGTAQSVIPWARNPNFMLIRTMARYHLPMGRSTQMTGVTPDFEVERYTDPELAVQMPRERDLYLYPVTADGQAWIQPRPALVSTLTTCSATDPAFSGRDQLDLQMQEAVDLLRCSTQ